MPSEVLIVADDLSGAADCAIACVSRGMDAVVTLDESDGNASVVAIDADTRELSPGDAAAKTARLVQQFGDGRIVFKKIDSRLRGNIGAEVAGALRARRCTDPGAIAIVAPAFPLNGRITTGGRQFVNGVDVGDIAALLEAAGLRVGTDAIVCEAETEDDLRRIALYAIKRSAIWVGSGGLARYLPDVLGLSRDPQPVAIPPVRGSIAIVVGSPSGIAREQARALAGETVADLEQAIAANQDALLVIDDARDARKIAPFADRIGAYILTGGETARAALDAIGVRAIRPVREIEPGVPLSLAHCPIITKSGAFGDSGTLVRCLAALRDL